MKHSKLLLVGLGVCLLSSKNLTVNAVDLSVNELFNNVGIAAVTNEVMEAEQYIEYAENSVSNTWGYENLGIAVVDNNLNVRENPTTKAAVVGKMGKNAACEILEEVDGWYHIISGEVEGYVSAEYIATGIQAKLLAAENAYAKAIVNADRLNVRAEANEQSKIVTKVSRGYELTFVEEANGWVKCKLNAEDVYVKADYIEIREGLNTAVTLSQLKYGKEISDVRVELCEYALQFVGNPYVWGGTSLTKGADCSGFVLSVYKNYGFKLPHYSGSQANLGTEISYKDAEPGDLLFYGSSKNAISHVAIYIGGGQIVHANDEKTGIIVSSSTFKTPVKAVRLLEE